MSSESTEFLADGTSVDDRPVPEEPSVQAMVLRLVLFGGLLVGLFAAAYTFSERFRPVESTVTDRVRLIEEEGARFEAISVGSSHTSAVDFYALELDGLPLWSGGMDYYQVNYILDLLDGRLPNVRFVFIPADITIYGENFIAAKFGAEGEAHINTYIFGARMEGFGYLRLMRGDIPIESNWKKLLEARVRPVSRLDSWEGVFERLRNPGIKPYRRTPNGTMSLERKKRERLTPDSLMANALEVATGRLERREGLLQERPGICEIGPALMDGIVEKVRQNLGPEVITVFYSDPAHPTYVDAFEQANQPPSPFATCTPAYYAAQLDREHDNVIYVDLRYYEPIQSDPVRYLANGDHFNRAGSQAFSEVLRERLAERLQAFPRTHPARELVFERFETPLWPAHDTSIGKDSLVRAGWRRGEV